MTTNRPLKVFLCHSSADKPAVRELYQKLRNEPWIQPWLDEEELFPGMDWNLEIEKAIEATDVILVCLSNNSITKEGYVQREIRIALDYADYKPEGTLFIIPVRMEECKPPKRLAHWQYADYFEGQRERALKRLFVSFKRHANSLGLIIEAITDQIIQTENLPNIINREVPENRIVEKPDDAPDWLSAINSKPNSKEVSEAPDWLSAIKSEPASKEVNEAPDWLSAINSEPVSKEVSDVPDWLSAMKSEPTPEKRISNPEGFSNQTKKQDLPSVRSELLNKAKDNLDRGNIPEALIQYGKLIKKGKHLEEIIRDLRDSLYRYPVEVSIWQMLGDAYMRANLLKESLDAYNKANELMQ